MNINPAKWDWSQWLATIMYFILVKILTSVKVLYTMTSDFFGGALLGKIFIEYIPIICAIVILVTAIIAQLYVYGFYVDVTLEYVMIRLAIPGGILATYIFLSFVFSMPLHMGFSWASAGVLLITALLYAASILLCYHRVEFRLVDMSELEQLEYDIYNQADVLENKEEVGNGTPRAAKRLRRE